MRCGLRRCSEKALRIAPPLLFSLAANGVLWSSLALVGLAGARAPLEPPEPAPPPVRIARVPPPVRRERPRRRISRPRRTRPASIRPSRPARDRSLSPGPRHPAPAVEAPRASALLDALALAPLRPGPIPVGALSRGESAPGPVAEARHAAGPEGRGSGGEGPGSPPVVVYRPDPEFFYPIGARVARLEGWARVKLLVDERGRAAEAEVVEARPRGTFDAAALRYVKSWRFVPARRAGRPVARWCVVTVRFTMGGER